MKKIVLVLAILFCAIITNAQAWKWAVGSKCPKGVIESWTIAVDSHGNVYEWGVMSPSAFVSVPLPNDSLKAYFGHDSLQGLSDFLVSVDSNGNYRWAILVNYAAITKIVTSPSNDIYLFGVYNGSLTIGSLSISTFGVRQGFIAKLNSSGTPVWLKNSPCTTGTFDAFHNCIYVSGAFTDPSLTIGSTTLVNHSYGSLNTDVFIAKLDTSGNPIWAKSFGGDSSETVANIACTPSGDVYVSGLYTSPHFNIGAASFGNPSGGTFTYSYTAKFDSSGNPKWGNNISSDCNGEGIYWMDVDVWGNAYVTGGYYHHCIVGTDSLPYMSAYSFVMFVAKYGNNGALRWAKSINDYHYPIGHSIAPDVCGNVWVCVQDTHGPDYTMLFKYDTSGNLIDSVVAHAGGDDQKAIVVDNKGNLYLGGDYMVDKSVFGNDTLRLVDSTLEALFIAKYAYPFCAFNPHLEIQDENENTATVKIYPNPANRTINIATPSASVKLTICDLSGRLLLIKQVTAVVTSFDVSAIPRGMYFAVWDNGAGSKTTQKIVVE